MFSWRNLNKFDDVKVVVEVALEGDEFLLNFLITLNISLSVEEIEMDAHPIIFLINKCIASRRMKTIHKHPIRNCSNHYKPANLNDKLEMSLKNNVKLFFHRRRCFVKFMIINIIPAT